MASGKPTSWAYCEDFGGENEIVVQARRRGSEIGAAAVTPGIGAALRMLVAALGARAVVEIGTGSGVGSLYVLDGMQSHGVLTTIDRDLDHQRAAREAFLDAGIRPARARTIPGRARDVLPRLQDCAYDLVVYSTAEDGAEIIVDEALRLLRPGGALVLHNALGKDRVADPAARDAETVRTRSVLRSIRDNDALVSSLLPVGDGLLVAIAR